MKDSFKEFMIVEKVEVNEAQCLSAFCDLNHAGPLLFSLGPQSKFERVKWILINKVVKYISN
jgi:hypothetical protein